MIANEKIPVQEAFLKLTPIREQEFASDNYSVRGFVDAIQHVENEVHIKDSRLGINLRFAKTIPFSKTEGAQYAVIPSVGSSDHKVLCENQAIKLDRLENC